MKIVICGSMQFEPKMAEIAEDLISRGYEVDKPNVVEGHVYADNLDANAGFVIYNGAVADAATAEAVAEGFTGENNGDIIYLLTSTDSANPATATLYSVTYGAENDATLASLATFNNLDINELNNSNFNQFAFIT